MIVIVDYKAGNLTSVQRALSHLGIPATISGDPHVILAAPRIVFPGVGHAATAMAVLKERGIDQALREAHARGTPLLGICLGSQILLERSEEGDTACLGLVPGRCAKLVLPDPALKIPHMGWNSVHVAKPHPLLRHVRAGDEFYFVHSYYTAPASTDDVYLTTDYGITFATAIGRGTLFATQFHPEKSGRIGLELLKAFAAWDGAAC